MQRDQCSLESLVMIGIKEVVVMKKMKKKDFVIFIGLGSISEKPVNIVQKLFYYLLVMNKVKNFCDHSMTM